MEGYRVGLIQVLPEFDTYGCLKAYAQHPDSIQAILGFKSLIRQASCRISWDVGTHATSVDHAKFLLNKRLGIRNATAIKSETVGTVGNTPSLDDLVNMSDNERLDYYMKCLDATNIELDPDTYKKLQELKK